ncbi:unnamed protein product, partial [Closterium sp. NIES-53]
MAHGNVLNLKPRSSPSSFIISTLPSGTPPPSPTPSSLPAKPLLFPLLPPLPLSLSPLSSSALPLFLPQDALEPHISRSALEAHWSGHHGRQLAALNRQLDADLALKRLPLEELVKVAYNGGNPLPCFNLAAEVGEVGGRGEEEDRREGRGVMVVPSGKEEGRTSMSNCFHSPISLIHPHSLLPALTLSFLPSLSPSCPHSLLPALTLSFLPSLSPSCPHSLLPALTLSPPLPLVGVESRVLLLGIAAGRRGRGREEDPVMLVGMVGYGIAAWNHEFFFSGLQQTDEAEGREEGNQPEGEPADEAAGREGGNRPEGEVLRLVERDFGSVEGFQREFRQACALSFGSGYVWLSAKVETVVPEEWLADMRVPNTYRLQVAHLRVERTVNAFNPLVFDRIPLAVLDLWE